MVLFLTEAVAVIRYGCILFHASVQLFLCIKKIFL
mgnify:CR=1 FL=1